ncbi:hypothetical protein M409DRAFT_20849 [Zasmidium cellare ATCC 36951]|uniref:Uncharacterized protein n=1 Tax=Zasmidium cellare ATCC 36951 TaxID=1080233 RepID=A0A6A6CNX4_ZASCE|nr:uncharacterized protein M409DRAFT_20849 [Zasmidium cellare ATCC 36951]KAF2168834.1 hypothetical protein M409DRAFT_20849 [Zasmidium cellare ATCC 36951]
MRLLRIVPLLALSSVVTAESASTPPEADLVARQVPAAQINVYCITHRAIASPAEFNATFEEACHNYSDRELQVGEDATHEKCFDDYCITTLLVFKCGNETSTSSIDYDSCRTLFGLPFNPSPGFCLSGGYVGSPAPGACWTALSLATPKESENRLPALSAKSWHRVTKTISARQAPQGVTACVPGDWQYSVSYADFYQDASDFCDRMVKEDVTLSSGESYWSENAYCNDATCLNFYVNFYCAAPGGGPAYGNVTWKGCMEFFCHPWWGYALSPEHGPCAASQGNVIKGGWVTDVNPNACWNFSSLVLAPLSGQNEMSLLPPAEHYRLEHNTFEIPGTAINNALVPRQSGDGGVLCSQETFHDIIHAFCMLYEYCPFLNDEPFNLTQHYDVLGQEVTLSVAHSGACLTGGKAGQDTCMEALEGMLAGYCEGGDDARDGMKTADNCWDFDIAVEPST